MALIKAFSHPEGGETRYWRVVAINIDALAGKAVIALAGYMSKKDRQAGAQPRSGALYTVTVQGAAFAALAAAPARGTLFNALAGTAYGLIKAHRMPTGNLDEGGNPILTDWLFADAEDDL